MQISLLIIFWKSFPTLDYRKWNFWSLNENWLGGYNLYPLSNVELKEYDPEAMLWKLLLHVITDKRQRNWKKNYAIKYINFPGNKITIQLKSTDQRKHHVEYREDRNRFNLPDLS